MKKTATTETGGLTQQITDQLRELGATVFILTEPGLPTLLVGYGRRNVLMNVEGNRGAAPSFDEVWQGAKVRTVSTLTQACQAMGLKILVRQTRAAKVRRGKKSAPRARLAAYARRVR